MHTETPLAHALLALLSFSDGVHVSIRKEINTILSLTVFLRINKNKHELTI